MNHIPRTVILFMAIGALALGDIDLTKLPKRDPSVVGHYFFNKELLTFPPKFTQQPEREIAYKVGDTVTGVTKLPCVAQGDPEPEYYWEKDGKRLEILGVSYKKQVGEGTLIIEDPQDEHEGLYQCFAKNEHGTAVAVKTRLRKAMLEPFDSVTDALVHVPEVGSYLVLRCHPPKSYPSGSTYWGISSPGDKFSPVANNERVSLDYEGNLHFANIIMQDYNQGKNYMCIVNNNHLRGLVQGDDQKIQPRSGNIHFSNVIPFDSRGGSTYVCVSYNTALRGLVQGDDQKIQTSGPATPPYKSPQLVWSSPTETVGLHGLQHKMKCIFSGYPTPKVQWERLDGDIDPNRVNPNSNYGLELAFEPVDFSDEGRYRCSASNKDGEFVTQEFKLTVESMPFWVRQMENFNTAEEEDAEFECFPGGRPASTVSWTIDGLPFENLEPDSRRTLQGNKLVYRNVTKSDSQVIQCNATNKHGYIFANAYLNVLAEPPTFIKAPEPVIKKAEGQAAIISCRVFGAPNPKITWFFEDEVINNPRFTVNKDGDLVISSVAEADRGDYKCLAENKFGKIDAQGTLIARQRTMITVYPESKDVNASTDVKFECGAKTDPLEEANLKITWKRNGKDIDFSNEPRMRLNVRDNSLTIIAATVDDTAHYTCVADNGLDQDEITATLSVKDRPSPPTNVKVKQCGSRSAEIEWVAGNENGEPVIELIVYYNTSFDKTGEFKEDQRVPRSTTSTIVDLSPWANYTFHLRARNSLGASDPSEFTSVCTTQPDRPYKNPSSVCTKSMDSDKLVITWEPMEKIDHNGKGFHYIVGYKLNKAGEEQKTEPVYDWKQRQLVIKNQETFQEYEIYVQAANEIDTAPLNRLQKMIGYSGEGEPDVTPGGLAIDEDSLNATSAIFFWDSVDTSHETMKGLFTGYEIHYWKADDPDNVRVHQIPRESGEFCRRANSNGTGGGDNPGRGKRQAGSEDTHILDLWPFSTIQASILAKNSQKKGQLSDPPISFSTPEGVPGRVPKLEVTQHASHHLEVSWEPPTEPNGILVGYTLGYREANTASPPNKIEVGDPMRRSYKIKDLTPDTDYILLIWAKTAAGLADEEQFTEGATVPESPPDIPGFADVEIGDDSLNVSFVPSQGRENNPGSDFYVQYREVGSDEWQRSDPDGDDLHTNITGLTTGALYEIVIVAVNGNGEETRSPVKKVRVGPYQGTEIIPKKPITLNPTEVVEKSTESNPTEVGEGTPTVVANIKIGAVEDESVQHIATAGWFVGMMCAIIFLLLILLIVCLIKRNRGGKYPVHEKEKLRGRDPEKDDEEGGFGEYTKTPNSKVPYMELKSDEPDYKKSAGSLESETKPLGESDEDSMLEYEETDPTKFNEDGSFIGQYGGKTKKEEKMEPDATSPSALSTFV